MEGKNLITAKSSVVQKESGIRAVPDPEGTEKSRAKLFAGFGLLDMVKTPIVEKYQ